MMKFSETISKSIKMLGDSMKAIKKYPILIFPLFLTWVFIASLAVYIEYYFVFPETTGLAFMTCFLILWSVTFMLSFSSGIMVEMVKHIETDGIISLGEAFSKSIKNIHRFLGISAIWAIVWFIIVVIEVALSKNKKNRQKRSPSPENIANTLGGTGSTFSWLGLGLDTVKRIMRMLVFLSIPAIIWKNKGVYSSLKDGVKVIGKHPVEFLGVYASTLVIGIIMAIPLTIIFTMRENGAVISDAVWIGVIIYEGIIFTLSLYLEQMNSAILYLWHMNWEKELEKSDGTEILMTDIPCPSLLDDIREFEQKM